MTDDYDWNALAHRAEAGQLKSLDGTAQHGEEAALSGRTALLAATGADTMEEAKRMALGRPRLSADENVTWEYPRTHRAV